MAATPSADIPQVRDQLGPDPDDVHIVHIRGEVDMSHEDELRGELRAAVAAEPGGLSST